jgi:two-component SAPR family response regulator
MAEKHKNVLIVEDDLIISMLEKKMLSKLGFNVYEPISFGEEALKAFKSRPVNLVIMDIALEGEMNGIEASQQIRETDPSVPIVFISGNIDQFTNEINQLEGHNLSIPKPFTVNDLKDATNQIYK